MSDNKDVVKSKVSMDLKNRKIAANPDLKIEGVNTEKKGITPATDKNAVTDKVVLDTAGGFAETDMKSESNGDKAAHIKSSEHDEKKDKRAVKRTKIPKVTLILGLLLGFILLLLFIGGFINKSGHYYYVESTISLPSDEETQTTTLSLGACIQDFGKQATPTELINLLHSEYNYNKKENDLVQNLVSTGCDTTLPLPNIKNGSYFDSF